MAKKSSWIDTLRSWFASDKLSKDLKKVKELSEKEIQHEDLKERLFAQTQKKKQESYVHIRTEKLLRKAGLKIGAASYNKRIFYSSLIITWLCFATLVYLSITLGWTLTYLIVSSVVLWTAGFVLLWLLAQMIGSFILDVRIDRRRREVEEVLPDFLQLTAANIGAGMPIDRALWYAVRPRFGILANEIETVAKHVLTGEDLEEALINFTKQYDSDLLKRSINLLLEGIAAGSHVAELLHKISVDIQDQRIMQQEMAANVMTYVIFIGFAAVLAAPILFGLATQLLVVIGSIVGNLGGQGSSSMMFSISENAISLAHFRIFSFVVLAGSSTMSALIIGVIRYGSPKRGLHFIPIFIATTWVLYVMSASLFAGLFGGLV